MLKYFSLEHPNVLNEMGTDFYVGEEAEKDGENTYNFAN